MEEKVMIGEEAETGQRTEPGSPAVHKLQERFLIRVPARHNPRLLKIIDRVNADDELYTLWQVINTNAVKRLGMSDHGPVHVQIVANIALKLLRLLIDRGVQPTSVA
ncbi:MAG: phosphohydrolase, partial [Deltaproteobacteria bacterium]